ncbi:MAG: hypothetical protein ACXIVD_15210 [Salinarimonas sp.]
MTLQNGVHIVDLRQIAVHVADFGDGDLGKPCHQGKHEGECCRQLGSDTGLFDFHGLDFLLYRGMLWWI